MKKINKQEKKSVDNKEKSFFEKMRTDKQYNAKVQLIGFGIFVAAIVIYLNIASMGSSVPVTNSLMGDINRDVVTENTDKDQTSLLKQLDNNYRYDVIIEVEKQNGEIVEETKLRYTGKSYDNQLEITKESINESVLYYKVDERYYGKEQESMEFVSEDVVYDLIDSEYIELDGILNLMDKASLDHVTDYSSGKKEYLYHLKVKDVIVSYKLEDVVEIEVEEENDVLKIDIDYSNLLRMVDENIIDCDLEVIISEIGKIEEFSVLNQETSKSTSGE